MLLYNWKKIFETADRKAVEIFRIFKMLTNHEIPESKFDPIYKYSTIDFSGTSFLVHPDVLLFNSYKYSHYDISVYLALASVRPLAQYIVDQTITLDLEDSPIDPRVHLTSQELISVENGVLHFLYEKTPPLDKQH